MQYEIMTYHITKEQHGTVAKTTKLEQFTDQGWELLAVTVYYYRNIPDGVMHYYRRPLK